MERTDSGRSGQQFALADRGLAAHGVSLAGVKTEGIPLDGQNVSDILLGAKRDRTEPIFWQAAVREGNWKLVKGELYNLEADPSEQNNRAKEEPERTQRMNALLQEWLKK